MIGFVAFSLRQALEGLWRNRVMTLAASTTMVLMLVLLSSLVIVISGMEAGLAFIESKVEIRAELNEGVTSDRVDALTAQLNLLPEVSGVTFISKEQALQEFRDQRAAAGEEDLTQYVGFNPFPAQLSVKLREPKEFAQVVATLQASPGVVGRVIQQQSNVDRLIGVTGLLRTVGLVVLVLVALTVLLIVVNTIRMAVMSRRDEIEIMRLVGASDAFIRWPFIFEGILVGLVGAVVTLALLLAASAPIGQLATAIAGQVPVGFSRALSGQVAGLVLGAGLGLGGLGAWISVRAYLHH
ncbi:MAG: cell division transport system permease protein [Chloroflexota bacterium]|nr:cell division transport system permease protein [Chloroflexota bacterium]